MRRSYVICFLISCLLACETKQRQTQPSEMFSAAEIEQIVLATSKADKTQGIAITDSLLNIAAKDSASFRQLTKILGKYFGDANSPYRNEDLFIHLLQVEIQSPWCDSLSKAGMRKQLYLRMQNRPGSKANDFSYLTASGSKKKMYDLHSDFILLYFYNPECESCKEMKSALANSVVINDKLKSGELKLLAIYPDKNELLWLDHLNELPETWMHGRDEDEYLYKNSVYNLKAIPTIYLLDKDKHVLLKDCMIINAIEQLIR